MDKEQKIEAKIDLTNIDVESIASQITSSIDNLTLMIKLLNERADTQKKWSHGKWMILLPWICANTCSIIYLYYFK